MISFKGFFSSCREFRSFLLLSHPLNSYAHHADKSQSQVQAQPEALL